MARPLDRESIRESPVIRSDLRFDQHEGEVPKDAYDGRSGIEK
jgi:hypothetical protein